MGVLDNYSNGEVEEEKEIASKVQPVELEISEMKDSILAQRRSLMCSVIQYSKLQKDLWQRVPYLAFLANRSLDSKNRLIMACTKGYLIPKSDGMFGLSVDLETGDLVRYDRWSDEVRDVREGINFKKDILRTGISDLNIDYCLNAQCVISELENVAKHPLRENDLGLRQWRRKIESTYNLQKVFKRDGWKKQ